MDKVINHEAMSSLKSAMEAYYPLATNTWSNVQSICCGYELEKGEVLYAAGTLPDSFAFVVNGLLRHFTTDDNGNEYNKIFFDEGTFQGSMAALLTDTNSAFTMEALEPSLIIKIAFKPFRQLLQQHHDLALFQIHYLEKNWLLSKEPREIALVQEDAEMRYQRFVSERPKLAKRLPQYLIASHLGITPTQLSRIRKKRRNQPM